jgi:lipoyl(octanoyl) transferase
MLIRPLRRADYASTWQAMQDFTAARQPDTPDELWWVEHPPVYTLGQAGKREHLLHPGEIPIVETDRGGQVTYHGPGQLVAYPLVNLKRQGYFVREYVARLEQSVIDCLAAYNVPAQRKPGAPGVYVQLDGELAKVAALGIKVKNGCTYHGAALNVGMDLTPFSWINPCGYEGLRTVDLATLGVTLSLEAVAADWTRHLTRCIEDKS